MRDRHSRVFKNPEPWREVVNRSPALIAFLNGLTRQRAISPRYSGFRIQPPVASIQSRQICPSTANVWCYSIRSLRWAGKGNVVSRASGGVRGKSS